MKTTPYHHGALREALLSTAETILQRDGLPALTLRATAREAGVSHAAPGYHFQDLTGLLSELAAVGFHRLGAAMREAIEAGDPASWSVGRAYVRFAADNPALFLLMFRLERLDANRSSLREARLEVFTLLGRARGVSAEAPTLDEVAMMTGAWSLVHGFAMLLIDGRLVPLLRAAPEGTTADDLLEAMLSSSRRAHWP
jgi:AcrR family transcriptional regulator